MVVEENGFLRVAIPSTPPITRRQDAPETYDLDTSVWAYTRKSILEEGQRIPTRTKLYVIPEERSSDLDTELDFQLLECFMEARQRSS